MVFGIEEFFGDIRNDVWSRNIICCITKFRLNSDRNVMLNTVSISQDRDNVSGSEMTRTWTKNWTGIKERDQDKDKDRDEDVLVGVPSCPCPRPCPHTLSSCVICRLLINNLHTMLLFKMVVVLAEYENYYNGVTNDSPDPKKREYTSILMQ